MIGRIVIQNIRPRTPDPDHPPKATAGAELVVSADVFADGHDVIAASATLRPRGKEKDKAIRRETVDVSMTHVGNDRWEALFTPLTHGRHEIFIEAWRDRWATWTRRCQILMDAGQDLALEMLAGQELLEQRLEQRPALVAIMEALEELRNPRLTPHEKLRKAFAPGVVQAMSSAEAGADFTSSGPFDIWVDRPLGGFSAWYELFPRSLGGFEGTARRLPEIARMGFDVVYLPPIHPIGKTARKGAGGSLAAGPDDPGSPWAIGSAEGGHEAIEPTLGTLEQFESMVSAATSLGLEIALDFALQCSPDHPWVRDHPEWFHRRADGSIAYAENPPKKYQDIVPINFWPRKESARVALWDACLDILLLWIERGIKVFRVDNPHTKPVAFWQWCIRSVHRRHPDVVFLAEAFTRPKVMAKLAEVGFTQSYSYFTWRNTREELALYGDEVNNGDAADYMRPNFWPNTPDILAGPLRRGPRAAFATRLVLAATMVPNFGIYSGYELCENEPASEANEEYFASEKYQLRSRDFAQPLSLAPLVTRLNQLRRLHPALQVQGGFRAFGSDNPSIFAFARYDRSRADRVVVVVNLDPYHVQESLLTLDLAELGLPWDRAFVAHDGLSGERYTWSGSRPFVRLDPGGTVAHVLSLEDLA